MYKSQIFVSLGAFLLFVLLLGLSTKKETTNKLPEDIRDIEDPKTALGVFYVTRTNQPMEGVRMLKSILEKDSDNKETYWYLGQFSMRSGQYEKAVEYFEGLLKLETDPSERFKTYIYLEDANISLADYNGVLLVLSKMREEFVGDTEIVELIDERIKHIKDNYNI